jgi:hypothetical protein
LNLFQILATPVTPISPMIQTEDSKPSTPLTASQKEIKIPSNLQIEPIEEYSKEEDFFDQLESTESSEKVLFESEGKKFRDQDDVFLKSIHGFYLNYKKGVFTRIGKHSHGIFHLEGFLIVFDFF